jgi:hypothetical protein
MLTTGEVSKLRDRLAETGNESYSFGVLSRRSMTGREDSGVAACPSSCSGAFMSSNYSPWPITDKSIRTQIFINGYALARDSEISTCDMTKESCYAFFKPKRSDR